MGKRVSIYIPDDVVESIEDAAKRDGRSVSNYLVQLHKAAIRKDIGFIDESGSISEEVYNNIETGNKPAQPNKFESHRSESDLKDIKKRVKKVVGKKKEEAGWINPLEGTALAPK